MLCTRILIDGDIKLYSKMSKMVSTHSESNSGNIPHIHQFHYHVQPQESRFVLEPQCHQVHCLSKRRYRQVSIGQGKNALSISCPFSTCPLQFDLHIENGNDLSLSLVQVDITSDIGDFANTDVDTVFLCFGTNKLLLKVGLGPIQAVLVNP